MLSGLREAQVHPVTLSSFRDETRDWLEANCPPSMRTRMVPGEQMNGGQQNHNPNPEDMAMLDAVSHAVKDAQADIGLAFDGDGDRCGVVTNEGHEIFADKVGVHVTTVSRAVDDNSRSTGPCE